MRPLIRAGFEGDADMDTLKWALLLMVTIGGVVCALAFLVLVIVFMNTPVQGVFLVMLIASFAVALMALFAGNKY